MRLLGVIIFSISLLNTCLVVFAFRDFSLPLVLMFAITIIGLPYGVHLVMQYREEKSLIEDNSEELDMEGLFTLGYEKR
jgi:hypothetical protein